MNGRRMRRRLSGKTYLTAKHSSGTAKHVPSLPAEIACGWAWHPSPWPLGSSHSPGWSGTAAERPDRPGGCENRALAAGRRPIRPYLCASRWLPAAASSVAPDEALDDFAILEHHQRGNARDAVVLRGCGTLIDVHLHDLGRAGVLGGDFVNHGRDLAARTTPGSPEINQYGLLGLKHLDIKLTVANLDRHRYSP